MENYFLRLISIPIDIIQFILLTQIYICIYIKNKFSLFEKKEGYKLQVCYIKLNEFMAWSTYSNARKLKKKKTKKFNYNRRITIWQF